MNLPRINLRLILLALSFLLLPFFATAETAAPRIIIGLYDGKQIEDLADTLILGMAEMPLNHLGLIVEYHDINQPLPDIADRSDVRGVLTWFNEEPKQLDTKTYIAWAEKAIDSGKKYVILGKPGFYAEFKKAGGDSNDAINHLLNRIGLNRQDQWVSVTPDVSYSYHTPSMFVTPEPFKRLKPSYEKMTVTSDDVTVHLSAHDGHDDTALITTGPRGSYIADEYLYHSNIVDKDETRQWYIDPFAFFERAFATADLPKPDTTTIAGRRIYYSHIDGDGWNNYVHLEEYRDHPAISAQVLLDKIIKPYPDLPVTVTAIAGDLDPKWAGSQNSQDVARAIFAMPQVEAGTHTYSHPFYWSFFADGNIDKEMPYLKRYHYGSWDKTQDFLHRIIPSFMLPKSASDQAGATDGKKLPQGYFTPRAYANERYDVHKEIEGSITYIGTFLPQGKKMKLLTWPGDCQPYEEAVRLTREAGIANINGGDSRFDPEYPSYASVAAIGKPVGKERQIYASTSNENTYTGEWTHKFHNFKYLPYTLEHTETPRRIKPLNIYYHLFSAERIASLKAVLSNIDYAEHQQIVPIAASDYSEIAQGFYTTELVHEGNAWRVKNRGALGTIRFDDAAHKFVDFGESKGVIGERHFQDSLYVYLDASVKEPLIALGTSEASSAAYLMDSRWPLSHLEHKDGGFSFTAQGFGDGEMSWHVPASGTYTLHLPDGKTEPLKTDGNTLTFTIHDNALAPRDYSVSQGD